MSEKIILDEAISIARKKADLHKESADTGYELYNKEPKSLESAMHLREAKIATEFVLLYKMITYNIESAKIVFGAIEELTSALEKLDNISDTDKEEILAIREHITDKFSEKLGPLKEEFDRWSVREKNLGEAGAL